MSRFRKGITMTSNNLQKMFQQAAVAQPAQIQNIEVAQPLNDAQLIAFIASQLYLEKGLEGCVMAAIDIISETVVAMRQDRLKHAIIVKCKAASVPLEKTEEAQKERPG